MLNKKVVFAGFAGIQQKKRNQAKNK